MHKSLDVFQIRPDPTTGFHGNRWCYNLKYVVANFFSVVLDGILFILAGNQWSPDARLSIIDLVYFDR